MVTFEREHIERLIALETHVHYAIAPPPDRLPFVALATPSPVLISAPHGAMVHRNSAGQIWHDEEEYTTGIALLLAEICQTSVIATLWRTEQEDPSYHVASVSSYKRALRQMVETAGVRWVIDLHGAAATTRPMAPEHLVDLGTRRELQSLPATQLERLTAGLEAGLGPGTVSHNRFPARQARRTITAYCHGELGCHAVQVEMKPAVRVARRRPDSVAYAGEGPFSADPAQMLAMLHALADFILYLQALEA